MPIGRILIFAGLALLTLGLLLTWGKIGRLPGDIEIRGAKSVFYFPVITCLLLSAIGSLILWLINRR